MPLLAINLSAKTFAVVRELVEEGRYSDLDNFIEVASLNQIALERGASPSELIARGHREPVSISSRAQASREAKPAAASDNNERLASRPNRRSAGRISRQTFVLEEARTEDDVTRVLEPFTLVSTPTRDLKPTDPEGSEGMATERVFGQVNRLLPLKLVCRWLTKWAFSSKDGTVRTEWPNYSAISDQLGDHAAQLGSLLEKWDIRANRKRDDQLATGLPRQGNSASRDRFLSQFLARITRAGHVYPGAICQYQLARFQGEHLTLTHQGVQFALIKNPIFETADAGNAGALSQEEIEFLSNQILEWVPQERNDMRFVLQAIAAEKITPTELTKALQSKFPGNWTSGVTLTYISGLVARLTDLQLVRRRWQGRNVEYELGDRRRVDAFLKP